MLFVEKQGCTIPKLGLGTWESEGEDCYHAVSKALAEGYRHIDTAQAYGNEEHVGRAIAESHVERDAVFLTTKIWIEEIEKEAFESSLDESLSKLRTDYVDLVLLHWPVDSVDYDTQMKALESLQKKGKSRFVGVSNYTTSHLEKVRKDLNAPVVTNQVEYHPYLSQAPVLDFLRDNDMFLTAYSPLARGGLMENDTLQEIARNHGKKPGQVILRWHMQQPDVVAIPKSTSDSHIEENLAVFDFELSDDEMDSIFALQVKNERQVDPDFAPEWDKAEPQKRAA